MDNLPDNLPELNLLQRATVKRIGAHAESLNSLKKSVSDKESEIKVLQELLESIEQRKAQLSGRPFRPKPSEPQMIELQSVLDMVEKNGLTWAQLGRKLNVSTSRARGLYEKAGRMIRYGRPS